MKTSKSRHLVMVLIGICLSKLLIAQAQISIQKSPTNNSNHAICEGGTVILSIQNPPLCSAGLSYEWRLNNGSIPISTNAQCTLSNFSNLEVGIYSVEINACSNIYVLQTYLSLAPNPQLSIRMLDSVCYAASNGIVHQPSISQLEALGASCNSYQWQYLQQGNWLSLSSNSAQASIQPNFNTPPPLDTFSLVLKASDAAGCEWSSRRVLQLKKPPFSDFNILPNNTSTGSNPINLANQTSWANGFNANSSSAQASLTSGPGAVSALEYYPLAPGTAVLKMQATNAGCTYHKESTLLINSGANLSYSNISNSAVSNNWEACVNDSIFLSFSNFTFLPDSLVLRKLGNQDTSISLAGLNYSYTQVAGLYSGSIRFRIPSNLTSGNLKLKSNTQIFVGPRPLLIQNPERGFALVKTPVCYLDSIRIYAVPSGGSFSAYHHDIGTNPRTYSRMNPNLIIGDTMLAGAGLALPNSLQNNGGGWVLLEYKYLPKYSNGAACPDTLRLKQELFIKDNRLLSASLPTINADNNPNAVYNLNQGIRNIFPQPVSPYTNTVDTAFNGTFVRRNSQGQYEFLKGLAGAGEYLIQLQMNDAGCLASTTTSLYIQPAATIPDLPSVICSGADSVLFHRDSQLVYQSNLIDTTYRLHCPQIIIGNNGVLGSLRGSEADSLNPKMILPKNALIVGDEQLFEIEDSLDALKNNSIAHRGCSHVKNSLRTRTINQLISVEAYADMGTPLSHQQVLYGGSTLIPNAVARPNGYNNQPENFYLKIPTIQSWMQQNSGSDSSFYVAMIYRNITRHDYYTEDGLILDPLRPASYDTSYNSAIQRILLVQLTQIGIIDSLLLDNYCFNATAFNVPVSPAYEAGYSTIRIQKIGATNSHLTLPSQLLDIANNPFFQDSINRNYIISYTYSKYHGCNNIGSDTFTVIAPILPYFTGPNTSNNYCLNGTEIFLTPYPLPNTGLGAVFSNLSVVSGSGGIGVDNQGNPTVNNMFAPKIAGLGSHQIQYSYTDVYGCNSKISRTLRVLAPPVVSLSADRSNNSYCANDTAAYLTGRSNSSVPGTGHYYGPTIVNNNIFRPNQAYLLNSVAAAGGVKVWFEFVDSFACKGTDSLNIYVHALPVPQIVGLNTEQRYCLNASPIALSGQDLATGPSGSGYFIARGIAAGSNSYQPARAGVGLDTLKYIRTNIFGCSDSSSRIINIDSIPRPQILNLARQYCINDPAFTLQGNPTINGAPAPVAAIFSGIGVSYQSNNNSFIFNPQLAANAGGLGQNLLISYEFTDSRGCRGLIRDSTTINGLPYASFSLANSYCVDAPLDSLIPNSQSGNFVRSYFSGDGIVDSLRGILSPALAAAQNGFGLQSVRYHYTDQNGCQNSTTKNYIVNRLPTVQITGLQSGYCNNHGIINIQGFPIGLLGSGNASFSSTIPNNNFSISSATDARVNINPMGLNSNSPYRIIYFYRDANGCSNRDTAHVEFFAAPNPSILNLQNQYCENQDTFLLAAQPAGGVFTGPGTNPNNNYFLPFRAGSGTHNIRYTAQNQNIVSRTQDTIICSAFTQQTTQVRPLPVPFIQHPFNNAAFCSNDTRIRVLGGINNQSSLADSLYYGNGIRDSIVLVPTTMTLPNGNTGIVYVPDTIYFFHPNLAGPGTHRITYRATNIYGCVDSATNSFVVHALPQASFNIGSQFCESDAPVFLSGSPAGGIFRRNGLVMNPNVYYPNPNYPNNLLIAPHRDTLIYTANNAHCIASDTNYTTVYPNPIVSFQGIKNGQTVHKACLGKDTIQLIPSRLGGQFSGNGVLFGSTQFNPTIAGIGRHPIRYQYTDNSTGCIGVYWDTFSVYSNPQVRFGVEGACGNSEILFLPDNQQLGLNGSFAGTLFDSITLVRWNLGDGTQRVVQPIGNHNLVDTIHHQYQNAGVYQATLLVENRAYCSHSDTVRVVVSPTERPLAQIPYSENFETNSGGWFEESENGHRSSNLWYWAVANGQRIKTGNDPLHRKVWVTHPNTAYGQNESGWVYSPCFDLTALDRPLLKLDYYNDTDPGNDGVVIEYYNQEQGKWLPLGDVNRGINWYNKSVIAGRPGIQDLAPKGWSGIENSWKDARYQLDPYRHYQNFRFRIAFGAVGVHNQGLEGFAFDNIWIGNRSRNVLLEHFSNIGMPNVHTVNDYVYQLIYGSPLVRDVVLMQVNTAFPAWDRFNSDNAADASARVLFYGLAQAGLSVINGKGNAATAPNSAQLSAENFEAQMLESPKFEIGINNFQVFGNQLSSSIELKALENLPFGKYELKIAILEDSMPYSTGEKVHSLLRKLLPDAAGTSFTQAWTIGANAQVHENWTFDLDKYNPAHFELIAWIQNKETKEVYQVVSSRDISGYSAALGSDEAEAVIQQSFELNSIRVYPNPARNWAQVDFEEPLLNDYIWRVFDLSGRVLSKGQLQAGEQSLELEFPNWSAGVYIFRMERAGYFVQRKIVVLD